MSLHDVIFENKKAEFLTFCLQKLKFRKFEFSYINFNFS